MEAWRLQKEKKEINLQMASEVMPFFHYSPSMLNNRSNIFGNVLLLFIFLMQIKNIVSMLKINHALHQGIWLYLYF